MSETEAEIMEVLWGLNAPIATADLLSYFANEREKKWKMQTLSTFLVRLAEKGLVTSTAKGRGLLYSPALTFEEYRQTEAKSLLDSLYAGSTKNFLSALYGNCKASNEEIEELKHWLAER